MHPRAGSGKLKKSAKEIFDCILIVELNMVLPQIYGHSSEYFRFPTYRRGKCYKNVLEGVLE